MKLKDQHAIKASQTAQVFAFEPEVFSIRFIEQILILNKLRRILFIQAGFSNPILIKDILDSCLSLTMPPPLSDQKKKKMNTDVLRAFL
jgi:hypothetical protein